MKSKKSYQNPDNQTKSRINLLVSTQLKEEVEDKAQAQGLDLSSVIRLMLNDFNKNKINIGTYYDNDPIVDIETESRISKSIQDFKDGNFQTLKSKQEISEFVDSLDK